MRYKYSIKINHPNTTFVTTELADIEFSKQPQIGDQIIIHGEIVTIENIEVVKKGTVVRLSPISRPLEEI